MVDENGKHGLNLDDRKSLVATGIKHVVNYDENEIILETNMGTLALNGKELNILNLDLNSGELSVAGRIDGLIYSESASKSDKKNLLRRLLK